MEWQPIDTAPLEDGKHVLLFGNGETFELCTFIGSWDVYDRKWYPFDGVYHVQPTHWMPLPPPPAA